MGHREEAERYLEQAGRDEYPDMWAPMATAHAVLALLDYLQQDDEEAEITAADLSRASVEAMQRKQLERERDELVKRVKSLEEQLETTRVTLRAHEAAVGDSMRQRKIEDAGQL